MELASILEEYQEQYLSDDVLAKKAAFKDQKKALNAMITCRTDLQGEVQVRCSDCGEIDWFAHSCGHRSCPKCQNHETGIWLKRQIKKLLPVDYFLVTFTLPAQIRGVTYHHQGKVYELLFKASTAALKEICLNPKKLGGAIGLTGVLHTHSRRLDYHPHVHYIVPGIAIDAKKRMLIRSRPKYLIHGNPLGKLFRGKFLTGLKALNIKFDSNIYRMDWVVDTKAVGGGESTLKYLSRYLYRGVISERNILEFKNGEVTFRYIDSDTGENRIRTLAGYKFVKLMLSHVLPKGFRRTRDYGFLHGNAKKTLNLLQLLLITKPNSNPVTERPLLKCKKCGHSMQIVAVKVYRSRIQKRIRSPP